MHIKTHGWFCADLDKSPLLHDRNGKLDFEQGLYAYQWMIERYEKRIRFDTNDQSGAGTDTMAKLICLILGCTNTARIKPCLSWMYQTISFFTVILKSGTIV